MTVEAKAKPYTEMIFTRESFLAMVRMLSQGKR
jgi:hypothetical protein